MQQEDRVDRGVGPSMMARGNVASLEYRHGHSVRSRSEKISNSYTISLSRSSRLACSQDQALPARRPQFSIRCCTTDVSRSTQGPGKFDRRVPRTMFSKRRSPRGGNDRTPVRRSISSGVYGAPRAAHWERTPTMTQHPCRDTRRRRRDTACSSQASSKAQPRDGNGECHLQGLSVSLMPISRRVAVLARWWSSNVRMVSCWSASSQAGRFTR
jgi:hypothetical protein